MWLEQGKQGRSKGDEVINVGRGPIMEGLMVSQALALPSPWNALPSFCNFLQKASLGLPRLQPTIAFFLASTILIYIVLDG